ncbi:MAG: hypothetical protein HQL05_13925 [Nitrospirae bacterium]|nr:hypothetical protein [Nitrospirota bacterium]
MKKVYLALAITIAASLVVVLLLGDQLLAAAGRPAPYKPAPYKPVPYMYTPYMYTPYIYESPKYEPYKYAPYKYEPPMYELPKYKPYMYEPYKKDDSLNKDGLFKKDALSKEDPKLIEIAKTTNRLITESSVFYDRFFYYIVEQHPSMHMLYDSEGKQLEVKGSFEIRNIVKKLIDDTRATKINDTHTTKRKEIYLALQNYTPKQRKGFEASVRIWLAKEGISDIKIRTLLNPKSRLTRDFLETAVGIDEIKTEPYKEKTGDFKGWFKTIVSLLTKDYKNIEMNIYTKTEILRTDVLQLLNSYLTLGSIWHKDVREGTQAMLVTKIRTELKADDELKVVIKDEIGNFQIVILKIENQENT